MLVQDYKLPQEEESNAALLAVLPECSAGASLVNRSDED